MMTMIVKRVKRKRRENAWVKEESEKWVRNHFVVVQNVGRSVSELSKAHVVMANYLIWYCFDQVSFRICVANDIIDFHLFALHLKCHMLWIWTTNVHENIQSKKALIIRIHKKHLESYRLHTSTSYRIHK